MHMKDASNNIAILLCTMHGHNFLSEQLNSIERQTHTSWTVWASDDSEDQETFEILKSYQSNFGSERLTICRGPARGFVANFLSLVCNDSINADYFAYADQDDIWNSDKLQRAAQWLQTVPEHVPALYCARTCRVNVDNEDIDLSPLITRPPCFANALVQSIASGNTMMFNRAARNLLQIAGPAVLVASHDWWTYMLVSGAGGQVFYDPLPAVRYRQHDNNLIGSKLNWHKRLEHARLLLQGRFRNWSELNIAALQTMRAYLTPENQVRLDEFAKMHTGGFFARLVASRRSGIFRQTSIGNLGLLAAVILKKI